MGLISPKHMLAVLLSVAVIAILLIKPTSISASSNTNLLSNASFEDAVGNNPTGWFNEIATGATGTIETVQTPVVEGNKAIRITAAGLQSWNSANVHQTINVEPGKYFELSANYYIQTLNNSNTELYVEFYDAQGNWINGTHSKYEGTSNGYIKLEKSGLTPENAKQAIVYSILRAKEGIGSGTLFVDDLLFTYKTSGNLLTNANYENVVGTLPIGWEKEIATGAIVNIESVSSTFSEGSKSIKMTATGLQPWEFVRLGQNNINVQPGKPFEVTGDFKVETLNNAFVQLNVVFYNHNDEIISNISTNYEQLTDGFVKLNKVSIIPQNANYAKVYAILCANDASGSGTIYVDNLAFTYSPSTNLMTNPGFENVIGTSLYSWQKSVANGATGLIQSVATPVARGSKAAKITATNLPIWDSASIHQSITVEPGKPFEISGDYKIETLNKSYVVLCVEFYDDQYNFIDSIQTSYDATTTEYTRLFKQGMTPANAKNAIVYGILRANEALGSGTIYLDNLSFAYRSSNNLLKNASYENAQLGWDNSIPSGETGKVETVDSPVSEGSKAIKLTATNLSPWTSMHIRQGLNVEPGKSYELAGNVKIDALNNTNVKLYVEFYDNQYNGLGSNYTSYEETTNGFVELKVTGEVPSNAAISIVYIILSANEGTGTGTIYLDNMRFTEGNTVLDVVVPTTPQGLTVYNITETSADLSWGASSDNKSVIGYDVYKGPTYIGSTSGTLYSINMLEPNKTYSFTVKAKDLVGNVSSESNSVTFTTDVTAPSAPTILPSTTAWTNVPIIVTITSGVDTGTGVRKSQYKINSNGSWIDYESPVSISNIGETTIFARTIDQVGNISEVSSYKVNKFDNQIPTTPSISLSSMSWSNTPVTVTVLPGNDYESGVKETQYKIGGNGTWSKYNNSFVVSLIGQTTVYARTIDLAGNISAEVSSIVYINTPTVPPTSNPDTDEPNDDFTSAASIVGIKKSYLSTSSDVDYYRWTASAAGKVKIGFASPTTKNYKLEIYNSNLEKIGAISPGGADSAFINVSLAYTYYVKVSGMTSADYGIASYTLSVGDADPDVYEPDNNATTTAPSIGFSSAISGFIGSVSDHDYFKFETGTNAGKVKVKLDMPSDANYHLNIYKKNAMLSIPDSGTGIDEEVYLSFDAGETYYIEVVNSGGSVVSSNSYTLSIGSIEVIATEPNDSHLEATKITPGNTYSSYTIGTSGDKDYYRFTANISGKIVIKLNGVSGKNYGLHVFRGVGNRLDPSKISGTAPLKQVQFEVEKDHVYYVAVIGNSSTDYDATNAYSLNVSSIVPDDESNDSWPEAKNAALGVPITSYISVPGDEDYYYFVRSNTGLVRVQLDVSRVSSFKDYDIKVYHENGTILTRDNRNAGVNEDFMFTAQANVKYYVKVYGYKDTDGNYGTEPYVLLITQQ
ncbi:OmpL47-type beta-barrel domain-containing protein [Paenibacillus oryzisoli]|uniref:Fibronectin type-III domain-containing protein n=1 Tax=Paenibacillus oryzisoli TaxID=1850517 RepID=A0A198A3I4_9BACL|nr:carbohydrate binding domain-containing protein [Paenibacillus oryzisoli]OAS16044.1 hypothetical protein A8708_05550 [Paenibacillus oryzisoli]